jgi:hypothetical protein
MMIVIRVFFLFLLVFSEILYAECQFLPSENLSDYILQEDLSSPENGICAFYKDEHFLISLDLKKVELKPVIGDIGSQASDCKSGDEYYSLIDGEIITSNRKSIKTQPMKDFYDDIDKENLWGIISGTFGGCSANFSNEDGLPYAYKKNGQIEFFGGSAVVKENDFSGGEKKFQRALAYNNDSNSAVILRHHLNSDNYEEDKYDTGDEYVSYFKNLTQDNIVTGLSPNRLDSNSDWAGIGRNLFGIKNDSELVIVISDHKVVTKYPVTGISLEKAKNILLDYGVSHENIVQFDGSGSAQLVIPYNRYNDSDEKSSYEGAVKLKGDGRFLTNVFGIYAKSDLKYSPKKVSCDLSFWDIQGLDWYSLPLSRLVEKGILKGHDDGSYRPNSYLNRVEALQTILRLQMPKPLPSSNGIYLHNYDYLDIDKSQWYLTAIYNAVSTRNDNVELDSDYLQTFGIDVYARSKRLAFWEGDSLYPAKEITRGEVAHLLVNALNLRVNTGEEYPLVEVFSDVDKNHQHYHWIMESRKNGIFTGYNDNTFKPDKNISRAEWAVVIYRSFFAKEENYECK